MDLDERSTRILWWVAGVLLVAVVVYTLWTVLGGLVFGLFLYYAVRPAYVRIARFIDDPGGSDVEDSRIAATATLLLVGVPMLGVLALAIYRVAYDVQAFLATHQLSEYGSIFQPYVGIIEALEQGRLLDGTANGGGGALAGGGLGSALDPLFQYGPVILGLVTDVFVMVVVAYYLLLYDDDIADWAGRTFDDQPSVISVLSTVDGELEHIYWGNLVLVVLTAVIAGANYYALQFVAPEGVTIPYVFLLAMATGVMTLVPAVGIKLVYFPMAGFLAYRAATGGTPLWFPVVFFLATLIVVDVFPDFVVRPWISAGELNMGLVLMAYVFGAVAFGWYGVFLGPIVLVVFLEFARTILPELMTDATVKDVID
ncbi:AI-2E family transporter [Halomicrobium salinisoli]|uniref:AI-2E family transporter n=1 Tax=Halomicrobium salinisoli TaxID=2878391 RepID=UPI001CF0A656|nr:AI-2E family transporter [Halomicrobium salinisoli]